MSGLARISPNIIGSLEPKNCSVMCSAPQGLHSLESFTKICHNFDSTLEFLLLGKISYLHMAKC